MQRSGTRCSYCHNYGHNIRTCNNPLINHAIEQMRLRYEQYFFNMPQGSLLLKLHFVTYLQQYFNLPTLHAIVCRLHIGNTTMSKRTCIECIFNYFYCQNNSLDNQNWYIDRSPDPIFASVDTRVSTHTPIVYNLVDDGWINADTRISNSITYSSIKMKLVDNDYKTVENFDCPICLDCVEQNNSVKLNCAHEFCCTCIREHIKTNLQNTTCALCRVKVTHLEVYSNNSCEKLKTYAVVM
jgi:hypothetical protein